MKKIRLFRLFLLLILFSTILPNSTYASHSIAHRVAGRILLQVEEHGEAWYIDPIELKRYYLGRPQNAYDLMRQKGLGIKHTELAGYLNSKFPSRLSGRILLDVERNGEAYYVNPLTLTATYLGRPDDAYALMRAFGLGITNRDLNTIPIAAGSPSIPTPTPTPPREISANKTELDTFNAINEYRQTIGLPATTWNDTVAEFARQHSENMAAGKVPFGHEGFSTRVDDIEVTVRVSSAAENVAYTFGLLDPVERVVNGWLTSEGHKKNIENSKYNVSGVGVARNAEGAYYITQIFIQHPVSTSLAPAYESKTITTDVGSFSVQVATLPTSSYTMITDTAELSDCSDNCKAKSLATYVQENGAFAGIHGSYFCPPDYSACASKKNSFDPPVFNSAADRMINEDSMQWHYRPFIAVGQNGIPYYFHRMADFGTSVAAFEQSRDTQLTAGIGNWPSLMENGRVIVAGEPQEPSFATKAVRGGIGWNGTSYYLVIAKSASVSDLAYVFKALNAQYAMNLDGGGSAALYYDGAYKFGPGRLLPNAIVFKKR